MGLVALGAGVAVLTGAGAGIGIGIATSNATGRSFSDVRSQRRPLSTVSLSHSLSSLLSANKQILK